MRLYELLAMLGNDHGAFSDADVVGISTDSRSIRPGELFIPISGENFNGHRFIASALGQGAVAALSSEPAGEGNGQGKIIPVEDTLLAYHRIAACYREKFPVRVVAVTGSNGKTTTKDLIHEVLSRRYRTLRTEANYNNEIGVPHTVMQLDEKSEMLVIELAMRGKGQIAQLAGIVKPHVGVITIIGEAHYELLGSYEAIADAKGELLLALPPDGAAVLNRDDRWYDHLAGKFPGNKYSFGEDQKASLRMLECRPQSSGGFNVKVASFSGGELEFSIPFLGLHNVYNTMAAVAVGLLHQVPPGQIQEALNSSKITGKRMEKLVTGQGVIVINDTYNASPRSMEYAIRTLALLPGVTRRIAVLGDMRELGGIAEEAHRATGRMVREAGIDYLVTLGDLGKLIHEEALRSGMPSGRCFWYESKDEAGAMLAGILSRGDAVLVKASRLMKLEEIVEHVMRRGGHEKSSLSASP
ncbi:MAG: UDP-N-acetylmuramoyl-tripeptide--D-alanyl-D-alanine ligase [Candidatus Eremiobacteraeota bacterium]|nr:UDP-N-acetylmuramoyl-tripeptide--D-alanyl-D-alanine ligase [Candidatus Eremiobacteraeota bacterium]